ncbi:hypothetical protein ACJ41O_008314 [Fusarium nematophilum]
MSLLDPPAFSQQGRSNKRKRPVLAIPDDDSASSRPSHLPPESINPLSHPPGVVAQFAIAGLSDTDENPSQKIPDFPHRGLGRGASSRTVEPENEAEDPDTEGDEAAARPRNKTLRRARGGHFDVLLQSIHHFLDQGDIEKASRAYGLLLQLRPSGLPVDIRRHSLWAIGAEILLRRGEQLSPDDEMPGVKDKDTDTPERPKRWGRAANMSKVRAYFDTLIQQHPYDYKHPRTVSALEFWLALLSCEIYNTHTEHVLALDCAAKEAEEGSRHESFGQDESFGSDETESHEARLAQTKDQLRLQALASMQEITKRMDGLMQDLPYSRNQDYLRLRAMASLYIADLVLPVGPASVIKLQEAQKARQMEQQRAREALKKYIAYGGVLDEAVVAILNPEEGSEEDASIPLYSSLPIRRL